VTAAAAALAHLSPAAAAANANATMVAAAAAAQVQIVAAAAAQARPPQPGQRVDMSGRKETVRSTAWEGARSLLSVSGNINASETAGTTI
jgi:hypothetical protein